MTDVPVWRAALNDSSHPLYSVAWDVFQENFDVEQVAQKYAERRDEIVPLLYAIIDTEELIFFEITGWRFCSTKCNRTTR